MLIPIGLAIRTQCKMMNESFVDMIYLHRACAFMLVRSDLKLPFEPSRVAGFFRPYYSSARVIKNFHRVGFLVELIYLFQLM